MKIQTKEDEDILKTIDSCLRNWYEPWKQAYLKNGREFSAVFDLMDGLLHYEHQIKNSHLSSERVIAIAQAVARLVDYGNAILGLDLIIRSGDDCPTEIDSTNTTIIELFRAHVRAHKLREKLVHDYFHRTKPSSSNLNAHRAIEELANQSNGSMTSNNTSLQIPSQPLDISHRSSMSSIASVISEGRRTPQNVLSSSPQIDHKLTDQELTSDEGSEISQIISTIKASALSSDYDHSSRPAILTKILTRVESLLSPPMSNEKIVHCFRVLDVLLETFEGIPPESRGKEALMIANSLLKPLVTKVYIDDRDFYSDFQQAHWTTCLVGVIRLMTQADFNAFLKNFTVQADLTSFLRDYLFVVRRFVSNADHGIMEPDFDTLNSLGETYPSCWIEMIQVTSLTFLTSLTYVYQILKQQHSNNIKLWASYIDCLVNFLLQESLKPGRYMLNERQKLLAEDIRKVSAEYIWTSWDSLDLFDKQDLLEDLIEPLLKASMYLRSNQRSLLLPIFYDMMRCDYTSQYIAPRGSCNSTSSTMKDFMHSDFSYSPFVPVKNESLPYLSNSAASDDGTVLTKFTHLIVGKLNVLMNDHNLGDRCFQNELCFAIAGGMNSKCLNQAFFSNQSDKEQFQSMARQTSDLISEFMSICLDLRLANECLYSHLHLLCLFKLILFFRDKVDRSDLHLNYLYKLCFRHHTAGRFIEAGYTAWEHARALSWSSEKLENRHRAIARYFPIPNLYDYASLKIFLYNFIIDCFEQGQLWEPAIKICGELVDYYQFKTFDYEKLAQILEKMSRFFSNIVNVRNRNSPEYFRVTFYGDGFPSCLRNTTMIYRGKPFEKLTDFQNTIQSKYSDAKLLRILTKPDSSVLNQPEAKYLQINSCSPIIDLKTKFSPEMLLRMDDSILCYYKFNECDRFEYSRRINPPSIVTNVTNDMSHDNPAAMWRERTTMTTNTLPGLLPFFPVFLVENSLVSPIESAIEDLERTNNKLSSAVNRFRSDKRQLEDVRLLGQLLLGIVDAAVNGGIAKYEKAFFIPLPRPEKSNEEFESSSNHSIIPSYQPSAIQLDRLRRLIAQQVPLLEEGIRLHRGRIADVMIPQHEHLEASYARLKQHVLTRYSKYLPSDYCRSSIRSYRSSISRSPNRSLRSDSKAQLSPSAKSAPGNSSTPDFLKTPPKRILGADECQSNFENSPPSSSIPYRRLASERRSLPFLSGDASVDREIVREAKTYLRANIIDMNAERESSSDESSSKQRSDFQEPRIKTYANSKGHVNTAYHTNETSQISTGILSENDATQSEMQASPRSLKIQTKISDLYQNITPQSNGTTVASSNINSPSSSQFKVVRPAPKIQMPEEGDLLTL